MTFTATFFRRNPQSRNGGYNTTRTIEAKTIKEATKRQKLLKTVFMEVWNYLKSSRQWTYNKISVLKGI